eukprot:969982_1
MMNSTKTYVEIKTTDVEGNTIVSVVTILVQKYLGLETDPIAEQIETELNGDGYDVEVEIKETDDDTDSDSQDEETMDFLDQKGVATAFIIGGALVMVVGGIALIVCVCKRRRE